MEKKKDPYMQEAYDMLEQMSADERKRLEYEAREKAIRDYNTQMYSVRKSRDNGYYIITVMLKKRKYGRNDCEYERCKSGNSERNRKKDFSSCINGKNT